jgi:hypothetical protein
VLLAVLVAMIPVPGGRSQASQQLHAKFRPNAGTPRNEWRTVMLRKTVIALAAAAVITAGSMISASAHGGGGHGGGGGGTGHSGGMSMGNSAHAGSDHAGFEHRGDFVGGRPVTVHQVSAHHVPHDGFHDRRLAFRHHHRFFLNTFAFYGSGYPYDDDCYRRVWTGWGWRLVSVCY